MEKNERRTSSVHGQIKVLYGTKLAKYLVEVILVDILGQAFHDNLQAGSAFRFHHADEWHVSEPTFVLLANGDSLASLASLPRPRPQP